MAGFKTFAFIGVSLAVLLMVSHTTAQAPCPPENPWCNVWVPCNYTEVQGPYCQDCRTRVICTAIGGLVKHCWFPGASYCVDGECVTNPSNECAPNDGSESGSSIEN